MTTQQVWKTFSFELFNFIFKRVKDEDIANDILQNSFLKIHSNLDRLKEENKIRQWSFQIVRNEIANHFNQEKEIDTLEDHLDDFVDMVCCFERFVEELPDKYKAVIKPIYIEGAKQIDVAEDLNLSLANVKARVRRAKVLLKSRFQECCKYSINESGLLFGESDCTICD